MLKNILNLYEKIANKKKWEEKKLRQCPFHIKWRQLQNDIKNAKIYDDFKLIQSLNLNLIWLSSISKFDFENKVREIRETENLYYWIKQPFYKYFEGINTNEIYNTIYLQYKENDLITPLIFDLNNEKHKYFIMNITLYIEGLYREIKSEGLYKEEIFMIFLHKIKSDNFFLEERKLDLPKEYIYKSLTFFSLYCSEKTYSIDVDYVLAMRDSLEKFV